MVDKVRSNLQGLVNKSNNHIKQMQNAEWAIKTAFFLSALSLSHTHFYLCLFRHSPWLCILKFCKGFAFFMFVMLDRWG